MPLLAFVARKGGVGKTSLAVNVAAVLAESAPVLLCDLDPQAAASVHLGIDYTQGPTLNEVFLGEASLGDVIRPTPFGVDVAPAHLALARTEGIIRDEPGRERILRLALEPLEGRYPWTVIDTPPSLGALTLNALCAADAVVLVAMPEFPSVEATAHTLQTIALVRDRGLNPDLRVLGIVANRVDTRTRTTEEVLRRLADLGVPVLRATIRKAVAMTNAYGFGEPVTRHDPRHAVVEDIRALVKELRRHAKT